MQVIKQEKQHIEILYTKISPICTSNQKKALHFIRYPHVDGFSVPYLKGILQKCKNCSKYVLNKKEGKIDKSRPYISFHVFEIVPSFSIQLTQPTDAVECAH